MGKGKRHRFKKKSLLTKMIGFEKTKRNIERRAKRLSKIVKGEW
jgi:hypothetical protein